MTTMQNHQLVALLEGRKTSTEAALFDIQRRLAKPELFQGHNKRYAPLTEDGEKKPTDEKLVQERALDLLTQAKSKFTHLMDLQGEVDATNCLAKADIVIDGTIIIPNCPVTYMMILAKWLDYWKKVIDSLPVLSADVEWKLSDHDGLYRSPEVQTGAMQKTRVAFVKAPATQQHPAQVEAFVDDVLCGYWFRVGFSSAVPALMKARLQENVVRMKDAVTVAREKANTEQAQRCAFGTAVADFLMDTAD